MRQQVRTFQKFGGKAEEAMDFYVSLFQGAAIAEPPSFQPEVWLADGQIRRVVRAQSAE